MASQDEDYFLKTDSHHRPGLFDILCTLRIQNTVPVRRRKKNFYKANYSAINCVLADTDWTNLFNSNNIDDNVNTFYGVLNNLINDFVPFSVASISEYPCCVRIVNLSPVISCATISNLKDYVPLASANRA